MSLTRCRDCGIKISTTAAACPNCGGRNRRYRRPINKTVAFWIVVAPFAGLFACAMLTTSPKQTAPDLRRPAASSDPVAMNTPMAGPSAVVAATPAVSVEDQARWQRCNGLAHTIMERTGAIYDRTTELEHNVFLNHPIVHDLMVTCGFGMKPSTSGVWNSGGYPSDGFFNVLAAAGAVVTGDQSKALLRAMRVCHRKALASADEQASAPTPRGKIECQAFVRDGGGVVMSIWQD